MANKKASSQFSIPKKMPHKYDLVEDAKQSIVYTANKTTAKRDKVAREILEDKLPNGVQRKIMAGQLIMFNYMTPIHKEELDYYDGQPVTLFFDVINVPTRKDSSGKVVSRGGKRVLGFNIHYYPPNMRLKIMDSILEIFKNSYEKYWDKSLNKQVNNFNYKWLVKQLVKAKLTFGVRMYDPSLIAKLKPIPAGYWAVASLTEGKFFKKTRKLILSYWKTYVQKEIS